MTHIRVAVVTVTAVTLSLLVTPSAVADPATDFITTLRESGFDPGRTPYDEQMVLIHASTACSYLRYDFTAAQARDYLQIQYPQVTPTQLTLLVDAAQRTLCKAQFKPVKPDW